MNNLQIQEKEWGKMKYCLKKHLRILQQQNLQIIFKLLKQW